MLYRHVFDKISTEFRVIFLCFCEFCAISRIYLSNFAAPRPREISEALINGLFMTVRPQLWSTKSE